jgi:hypothetical protein
MIINGILVIFLAWGYSMFLDSVLPGFMKISILPLALGLFILVGIFGGKQSAFEFFKKTAMYTFPLWVFGFSQYMIIHSPIMALLPANADVIVLVVAPSFVSIAGWMFWRFARYQDVARDAGVLLSIIVHFVTIADVLINGDMTRTVAMYATGALTVTLILTSTIYDNAMSSYAQKGAMVTFVIALVSGMSLLVISQKTSTRIEHSKTMVSEIEQKLKDGTLGAEARKRLKEELSKLTSTAVKNGVTQVLPDAVQAVRSADGQIVPQAVPFTGVERSVGMGVNPFAPSAPKNTLQKIMGNQTVPATPDQELQANQIDASVKPMTRANQLP